MTGAYIPAQYLARCAFCPLQLDIRSHRTFQRCSGWAVNKKAGSYTANLFLMERAREWACAWCIDYRRKKGRQARQGGKAPCAFACGADVDRLKLGTYQYCTGWVSGNLGSDGKKGQGRNSLAIPERLERYACSDCINRQLHGISLDQGSLF